MLRAGHGYDDQHRALLAALQSAQRDARNNPAGYGIAEADPAAADHGITRVLSEDAITWAVLGTDGAADLIDQAGHSWPDIARADADQLAALLAQLDYWETTADPDGRELPLCQAPRRQDTRRRRTPLIAHASRPRCRIALSEIKAPLPAAHGRLRRPAGQPSTSGPDRPPSRLPG